MRDVRYLGIHGKEPFVHLRTATEGFVNQECIIQGDLSTPRLLPPLLLLGCSGGLAVTLEYAIKGCQDAMGGGQLVVVNGSGFSHSTQLLYMLGRTLLTSKLAWLS